MKIPDIDLWHPHGQAHLCACTHKHLYTQPYEQVHYTTYITHAHMSSIRSSEYEYYSWLLIFFEDFLHACMHITCLGPIYSPSSPTPRLPISHHFSSQFHMHSFSKLIFYLNLNITKVMSDMETNSVKVSRAPIRIILRSLWILRA